MSLIYQSDIGAKIIAKTNNTTLSSGTFVMTVQKPSGAVVSWTAVPDFAIGQFTHTTVSGDLNEEGEYKVQIKATIGTDIQVSDMSTFCVYKKI